MGQAIDPIQRQCPVLQSHSVLCYAITGLTPTECKLGYTGDPSHFLDMGSAAFGEYRHLFTYNLLYLCLRCVCYYSHIYGVFGIDAYAAMAQQISGYDV